MDDQGTEIFLFSKHPEYMWGSTQPPFQWVMVLFCGT